jgi:hypothetical protein
MSWPLFSWVGDVDGGLVAQLGLLDVVGDEGEQGAVAVFFEAALDEVAAGGVVAGAVGDADHAVDALAVQDPFAGGDGVAGQFDALADSRRACRGLVGEGHARPEASRKATVKPMIW